ncbi:MAG: hypothetical protein ACRCX8_10440, partial [Sarcina sp.]
MRSFLVVLSLFFMFFNLGGSVKAMEDDMYPIFLGVVENVEKSIDEGEYRILVDGYIKGGIIKEDKIIALVSDDTKIDSIDKETKITKIKRGDRVYIEFSKAMTFSIPPQSFARKIEVYRAASY